MTDQPPFLLSDIRAHLGSRPGPTRTKALCDAVEAAQALASQMNGECLNPSCAYYKASPSPHRADCSYGRLIEALAKFTVEQEK